MDNYLLRIASINLSNNVSILRELNNMSDNKIYDKSEINLDIVKNLKFVYLEMAEELESSKIIIRYNALSKLFFLFVKDSEINFMLTDKLDENFENSYINLAFSSGLLMDLIKNFAYLHFKFSEYNKDIITLNKMKLSFFIKINAFLIFLILNFNRKTKEMKFFIKFQGDELEETILKLFKLSITHRYVPNRVLLSLHFLFIKILISEEGEEFDIPTCRKIEKREKFLHKKNFDNFLKPKIPKYFSEYEKTNHFIEKFYRRNIVRKDKGEIDRVVIVNVLKILLSTIENNSSSSSTIEFTKDYIPEIILKYYYVDQGNMMTFTVENTYNKLNTNNLNVSNNNISYNNIKDLNNSQNLNNSNMNNSNNLLNESNNLNVSYDPFSVNLLNLNQGGGVTETNNLDNSQTKADDKENLEFSAKTYLEILQNCPSAEQELYNIIDIINKVSITALIIYFYYYILKTLQNYDLIQYSYFSFHLIDSNGLLVFLKILSQDFKAIEQQFISIYDNDVINIQYGELIEFILLFDLKLIFKTCFKNDEYICKYLVECKLQAMLKKVLNSFPQNEKIKKYCMKLFKCQLKYFDKNWRLENANIISQIYLTLKIRSDNGNLAINKEGNSAIENYLKYEKKDKLANLNNKEVNNDYFSNEELKKIHLEYHNYNYNRFLNSTEEIDKYVNGIYQSQYARIYLQILEKAILPQEFIENYK